MVGPVHRQDRVLRHPPPALEELLQLGLRIARQRIGAFEQRLEQPLQHLQRPLHAAAQVHGGDHGFQSVGEPSRVFPPAAALFAAPEQEQLAEAELPGDDGQRFLAH